MVVVSADIELSERNVEDSVAFLRDFLCSLIFKCFFAERLSKNSKFLVKGPQITDN